MVFYLFIPSIFTRNEINVLRFKTLWLCKICCILSFFFIPFRIPYNYCQTAELVKTSKRKNIRVGDILSTLLCAKQLQAGFMQAYTFFFHPRFILTLVKRKHVPHKQSLRSKVSR